jgi:alkanesulfonate monooxygenase SsuD/methylene tetrahydromethanopterin reductase-like flavin-dependent oxidoreductase (luciferase family)
VKISLFYEFPLPRPWSDDDEHILFQDGLDEVEAADQAGFSTVWLTEHHFLEEYCHSTAPEIFLAAASQRTKDIRLGFGIMHLPPAVNHPARVAERVSTLDLLSNGRVEFGTGESSSVGELGGFNIDPADKRTMWEEALDVSIRCMTEEPFTGFKGQHIEMPPRNVVPKPLQKPHPPVWVACTRPASVQMAAQRGLGALSFAYTGPGPLTERVNGYYKEFEENGAPVTPQMNPNILAIGGDLSMMVAATDEQAVERLGLGGGFFAFGIMHYYMTGMHTPGRTGVWQRHLEEIEKDPSVAYGPGRGPIGSPATVREFLRTARVHRTRRKSGRRKGKAHGADHREGRGSQTHVNGADVRRILFVRRSAHRSPELHRQRGLLGDGRNERRYRAGGSETQVRGRVDQQESGRRQGLSRDAD